MALCVLLGLLLPGTSFSGERRLKGQVVLVGEHDEGKPVAGVSVGLKETGDPTLTKANGLFSIFLPDAFKAGERVTLSVEKTGWCIQYPLDGELLVPADLTKQLVEVRLLPVGSKKLWSSDRIEKFIRDTADKAKVQVKVDGTPREDAFGRYIKEWAVQYGFSAQQAKEEIDRWVAEIEQKQDDIERLGLAAYAKKNFGAASRLLNEAAEQKARKSEELAQEADRKARESEKLAFEAVEDFRLAGHAASINDELDKALDAYQRALQKTSREKIPGLWAAIWVDIGRVQKDLALRSEGQAIDQHLNAAISANEHALEVYTREYLPQGWAGTQNNLGNVLSKQGERAEGEQGVKLLGEAVAAYRRALEVATREQMPSFWAMTQRNLGNALRKQGERAEGEQGVKLLGEAVAAHHRALEVYTREQLPQDWAATQRSLGTVLWEQGKRAEGEQGVKLQGEAVAAYRRALEVYTREQLPLDWAATEFILGTVLWGQGNRVEGEEGVKLLGEAAAIFRRVLEVYTREQLPQRWAMMQHFLGSVVSEQAGRTEGEQAVKLLGEAVAAYHRALEVRTREQLPQDWAATQRSLASAYIALEDWRGAAAALADILKAFPDDSEAYRYGAYLNHSKLHSFVDARTLHQQWLKRHPDDLSSRANLGETLVTTGQFAEAEATLTMALAAQDTRSSIAIRVLEIAALLAQGKSGSIPGKLDALRTDAAARPEDFKLVWEFEGTRHFIRQDEKLAPWRDWLLQLLDAVEGKDRNSMLVALDRVRARFTIPLASPRASGRTGPQQVH